MTKHEPIEMDLSDVWCAVKIRVEAANPPEHSPEPGPRYRPGRQPVIIQYGALRLELMLSEQQAKQLAAMLVLGSAGEVDTMGNLPPMRVPREHLVRDGAVLLAAETLAASVFEQWQLPRWARKP